MLTRFVTLATGMLVLATAACAQEVGNLPAVPQSEWTDAWGGYFIAPWRIHTPELNDVTAKAWHAEGITAIHVDKNYDPADMAWARKHGFAVYLDHVAGKGYLYLRERKELISKKPAEKWKVGPGMLLKRPKCLLDPAVIAEMDALVRKHVTGALKNQVHCYSLDDEISTGNFLSYSETCWAEPHREPFRKFALSLYDDSLDKLNAAWGTTFKTADEITPSDPGYAIELVRSKPMNQWNFARWCDWRQFMDKSLADTLVHLVKLGHELDPRAPFGIEGAQSPATYGGYDYSRLCRSIQWIENYDYGNNDEIIRSLGPQVVRAKTFFSRGEREHDAWKLWYHYAHGNRGAILWPAKGSESWFNADATIKKEFAHLPPIFRELTGEKMRSLLVGAEFQDDGIAVYYSQPSIRVGWVLDSSTHHNSDWKARSGNVDQATSTVHHCRAAWVSMIEDAGLQYNFIDGPKVVAGELKFPRYRLLVLPAVLAMSEAEIQAVNKFVRDGGTVVADYPPGIFDEHGRCRLQRDSYKMFDGKQATIFNAEAYNKPLAERMITEGLNQKAGLPEILSGGGTPVPFADTDARGRMDVLNVLPISYLLERAKGNRDPFATGWVRQMTRLGIEAPVQVRTAGRMTEVIRWRKGGQEILCVVKNPEGLVDGEWKTAGIVDKVERLELTFGEQRPVGPVVNVRTGKTLEVIEGEDGVFRAVDEWIPCEAAIFTYQPRKP